MDRRTLLRRLGAGTATLSAATGLASAADEPMVFDEIELEGETVYVPAGLSDAELAELSLESACDCPLCPRCYPCRCDDEETLLKSLDGAALVR